MNPKHFADYAVDRQFRSYRLLVSLPRSKRELDHMRCNALEQADTESDIVITITDLKIEYRMDIGCRGQK